MEPAIEQSAEDTAWACRKCSGRFSGRRTLASHLSYSATCGDKAKAFVCPKCAAAFSHAHKLAQHLDGPRGCAIRLQRTRLDSLVQGAKAPEAVALSQAPKSSPKRPEMPPKPKQGQVEGRRAGPEAGKPPKTQTLEAKTPSPDTKPDQIEHGSVSGGSLSCPKCGKSQSNKHGLRDHLNVSKSCGRWKDRFRCAPCGSTFAHLSALAGHKESPKACAIAQRRKELMDAIGASAVKEEAACDVKAEAKEPEAKASSDKVKQASGPAEDVEALSKAVKLEEGSLECPKCSQTYKSLRVLQQHLAWSQSCGDKARQYKCRDCGSSFTHTYKLAAHMESKVACDIAKRRAELKALVGGSVKSEKETALKKTEASESSKPTPTARHVPSQGESKAESFACPKCGVVYKSLRVLQEHLDWSKSCGSKSKPFKCLQCSATFSHTYKLGQHIKSGVACRINKRREELRALLGDSVKSEGKDRSAQAECLASSKTKPYAGQGVNQGEGEAKSFSCPKCGRSYASLHVLQQHLAWSKTCGDKAKPFQCPRCSATFSHGSPLAQHMNSAVACRIRLRRLELSKLLGQDGSGTGKLSEVERGLLDCPKCGRHCANRTSLLGHLAHSVSCGDRPRAHLCPRCGKAFAHAHNVKRHQEGAKGCEANLRKRRLGSEEQAEGAAGTVQQTEEGQGSEADMEQGDEGTEEEGEEGPASEEEMEEEEEEGEDEEEDGTEEEGREEAVQNGSYEITEEAAGDRSVTELGSEESEPEEEGENEDNGEEEGQEEMEEEGEEAGPESEEEPEDEGSQEEVPTPILACLKCGGAFSTAGLLDLHQRRNKACR